MHLPATPGINYVTYDEPVQVLPSPSIFLAGATTDRFPDGQMSVLSALNQDCLRTQIIRGQCVKSDLVLSTWRAMLISRLYRGGYRGAIVIPEFIRKNEFEQQAQLRWGSVSVPEGVPVKPRSWGVYHWEKHYLQSVTVKVVWADFRDTGAGQGLNARPEAQGILEHVTLAGSAHSALMMRRTSAVALGISRECTGKTRFEALAYTAGITPARTLDELAQAVLDLCAGGET